MKSHCKILVVANAIILAGEFLLTAAAAQSSNTSLSQDLPNPPISQLRRQPGPDSWFAFPGGNPLQFVLAVDEQFKVDWNHIVTLPGKSENVLVPRLRIPVDTNLPRAATLVRLLELYNRLAAQDPTLGKWLWEGPADAPYVLMLATEKGTSSTNGPATPVSVRIFPLLHISGTNLTTLAQAITSADESFQESHHSAGRQSIRGRLVIDQRTASLIATGPSDYLELVKNIVQNLDVPTAEPPPEPKKTPNGSSGQFRPAERKEKQ